ncbi:hypothetical protein [Hyphomonas jannaschiana]|uniref:hypothetical protein n=1 Tax=Hyphomonas jannaschiana TaxID=86 RepID=UPI0035C6CE15
MTSTDPILVAGVNRPLGACIALDLAGRGLKVVGTRRHPDVDLDARMQAAGIELAPLDLTDLTAISALAPQLSSVILTPILSISGPAAHAFHAGGVRRGVVFSSNNVAIVGEDPVYDRLRAAEADVLENAPSWAILRPTMIYGYPGDGNLSRLLRMLARLPVFPRLGSGEASQQPIHFEDLARLAAALVTGEWNAAGLLAVGGPQILSHRELIATARRATGRGGIDLPVPLGPVRAVVSLLTRLGIKLPLSPAQLARIDLDKAAVNPADIPAALCPQVMPEEGLTRLALDLDI